MKLSEWAKIQGITYQAAWNQFKRGLIPSAYQLRTGTIIVPEENIGKDIPEYTVCYARISSSENRTRLESQVERLCDFCAAKGWIVKEIVKECASGLDDTRPNLEKLLKDPRITRIVVEHRDRLTRFGFNYIRLFKESQGCRIEVINEAENDQDDLMQDFVSIVNSFVAKLYGKKQSRRKTEKLIRELENENQKIVRGVGKIHNLEKALDSE